MESNPQPLSVKKQKSVTQQVKVSAYVDENETMRLSVGVPDLTESPPPMDVVCIVDISYSMCGSAACQTDGKTEYEDLGFSLIDLVKHAVKTVVKVMRPEDRLALVLFDDRIEVPYGFTQLTAANREEILSFVGGIRHRNSTNIYGALEKGIELISSRSKDETNNAAIMFFTDGQPNHGKYTNANDIVKHIVEHKNKTRFQYPIHTYAFGQYTNCTSDMLYRVATEFEGMFGYIQDAKTVGTIFINGIAYTLCSAASQVQMLVYLDGKAIEPSNECRRENDAILLPGLRYGQTSDVLFDLKGKQIKDDSKLKVIFTTVHKGKKQYPDTREIQMQKCSVSENIDHQLRFDTIKLFKKILDEFKKVDCEILKKETEQFVEHIKAQKSDSEFIPALLDTVERQIVTMLVKKKYVEKWGEHQLRHLIRSLEMQIKGNFREQCLKDFGGDTFNDLADKADDVYNSMDPPTPSLAAQAAQSAAQIQSAQQFAAKMNNFDDDDNGGGYYGGGCFAGHNLILMADGSQKLVSQLVKNDKIATSNGGQAAIKCVIKTDIVGGATDMCQIGDLLITPGHPIKTQQGKEWVYPRDLSARRATPCPSIYNLVVDQGHTAIINGVEVILLGHSYTEGILKHDYYGSQRVIEDLKGMPGFDGGLVVLTRNGKQREEIVKESRPNEVCSEQATKVGVMY